MKFWLSALDLFRSYFVRAGVDYPQLRTILGIKLTMDNRRSATIFRQGSNDDSNYAFIVTLSLFFLFGVFSAFVIGFAPPFIGLLVFFGLSMSLTVVILIGDFSAVLLDTSDNTILLPRPVSSRTLWFSRSLHVALYMLQISLALLAAPLVAALIRFGPVTSLALTLAQLLTTFISLFVTQVLYLLIMRFTTEERMKNIINYFQIIMAIVVMGGYQILPRLIDYDELQTTAPELSVFHLLAPPVWMAGLVDVTISSPITSFHVVMTSLGVLVPVCLWWLMGRLSGNFTSQLADLGAPVEKVAPPRRSFTWSSFSKWVTRTPAEQASFLLVYRALQRDRRLKLKVYPSIGSMFVLGFLMTYRGIDFDNWQQDLIDTRLYLVLIYLSFTIVQIALLEIRYSDDFRAAWVFAGAPVGRPGEILTGMWKAILIRFFVPFYTLITLALLLTLGPATLPDLVFGFVANIFLFILLAAIYDKFLPLSEKPMTQQAGNMGVAFFMFMILMAMGVSHYFLGKSLVLLGIALVPVLAVTAWLYLRYANTKWDVVNV